MLSQELKKQLIKDLNNLPFDSQKKVQEFAQALLITQNRGKKGRDMLKLSGILGNDDASELRKSVEAGCEKVDINEW